MNEIKNYIVLARKYRPKKLLDVVGQDEACKIIEGSVKLNRIAHAFLFSGTRGVGKTTLARILAKIVNCTNLNKDIIEPCGECNNCSSIDSDNNIDVIEIDAASRTGVADVREIIDNINYKPVSAKKKIFIIDEVHMLSKAAFNALLKTLEEPPLDVIFIFATTETEKIPLTILSRCQKFQLKRVDEGKISDFLLRVAKNEGYVIDSKGCDLISEASQGSVRDALSILDNVLTRGNPVKLQTIRDVLGLSDNTLSLKLFKSLCIGDVENSFKVFSDLYFKGISVQRLSSTLMKYMYHVIRVKAGIDLKTAYLESDVNETIKYICENFEMDFMIRFWELLQKYMNEINKCFDEKQCFEMIIMRLCYVSLIPTPFDLLKETENGRQKNNQDKASSSENKLKKFVKNEIIDTIPKNNLAFNRDLDRSSPDDSSQNYKNLQEFKLLINKIENQSEMLIAYHLKNSFKLVSLSENENVKEIELENISDKKDSKKILWKATKLFNQITGARYMISLSTKKGSMTIKEYENRLKDEQISQIKKNSFVKKLLEIIPSSEVISIEKLENLQKDKG